MSLYVVAQGQGTAGFQLTVHVNQAAGFLVVVIVTKVVKVDTPVDIGYGCLLHPLTQGQAVDF